jgi:hypothetical protein
VSIGERVPLRMNRFSSFHQPSSPIIFDFAQFLINSGKVEDLSAYGPIISRLGFKNEKFLEEMRSFWTSSTSLKKNFALDKVAKQI